MPPPLLRECILKRQKIPVAAEVFKATDRLLNPPPSLAGLTHPTHTLFPPFCLLCCGLDHAPTSDHHKHVGL